MTGSTTVAERGAAVLALHGLLVQGADAQGVHALVVEQVAQLMDGAAALWLERDGDLDIAAFGHPRAEVREAMADVAASVRGGEHAFVRHVLSSGEPARLTPHDVTRYLPMMEPGYRAYFSAHGLSGMLLQPLLTEAGPVGVLGVSRDAGRRPFDDDDARFLTQLSHVVTSAFALRRLVEEQRSLRAAAEASHARAQRMAETDDLTGLPNRRAFRRTLHEAARGDVPVALLLLDMDDFKAVNDGFGHVVGDRVLAAFSRHLRQVAPSGAVLARLGGDEFGVCLTGTGDLAAAAAGVVAACRTSTDVVGLTVTIDATGGLALSEVGVDAQALLQRADVALSRAKQQGAAYAQYSPDADAAAGRRLRDVTALREALADGSLRVHYQRIVPTSPRPAPARLEALVRWQHDGELELPGRFLPLAEQAGLMPALTDCVLRTVVDDLVHWWSAGRHVRVAINVPASVLAVEGFGERVVLHLSRRGLPRDALQLEVTESDLVGEDARACLHRCRSLGLDVVVDDFGTGFSALGYLLDVPLSTIKLDRTLVAGAARDPARRALLRHCVQLAGELGLQVVAEGIETRADVQCLTEVGVDWLQGFVLHEPGPRELALTAADG